MTYQHILFDVQNGVARLALKATKLFGFWFCQQQAVPSVPARIWATPRWQWEPLRPTSAMWLKSITAR